MCATCGCADGPARLPIALHRHQHDDGSWHEHAAPVHEHAAPGHEHAGGQTVTLEEKVLARNDALAAQNRGWLRSRGILALNLMSSPGAGKTTLLERTARDLAGELVIGVIEGDQETALDSARMRAAGCRVVQVNTGTGCHLDAVMVRDALTALDPPPGSVVVIENVGNLVCPAL
ncbi:MAG: hydrogenase nickel incorporation protein HypB, partial [Actinobacteria bacterium]|nr:hydrogenase nickel incorporation protein HypB [Actinomycetota bacterium]